jgi:hypothetical protein
MVGVQEEDLGCDVRIEVHLREERLERVVERWPAYLVVEKFGAAGSLAVRRNWRKPTG